MKKTETMFNQNAKGILPRNIQKYHCRTRDMLTDPETCSRHLKKETPKQNSETGQPLSQTQQSCPKTSRKTNSKMEVTQA